MRVMVVTDVCHNEQSGGLEARGSTRDNYQLKSSKNINTIIPPLLCQVFCAQQYLNTSQYLTLGGTPLQIKQILSVLHITAPTSSFQPWLLDASRDIGTIPFGAILSQSSRKGTWFGLLLPPVGSSQALQAWSSPAQDRATEQQYVSTCKAMLLCAALIHHPSSALRQAPCPVWLDVAQAVCVAQVGWDL